MFQDDAKKQYIELVNKLLGEDAASAKPESIPAAAGSYESLVVSNAEGVFTIRINRPSKKNALTVEVSNVVYIKFLVY